MEKINKCIQLSLSEKINNLIDDCTFENIYERVVDVLDPCKFQVESFPFDIDDSCFVQMTEFVVNIAKPINIFEFRRIFKCEYSMGLETSSEHLCKLYNYLYSYSIFDDLYYEIYNERIRIMLYSKA